VGAEEIGALAEKLEFAGKAGDTQTLDAELGGLLARYRALGKRLMPLLERDAEPEEELTPISEKELRENYSMILRLLEDFEYDRAAELIDYLGGCRLPEDERDRVKALREAAENFEWDQLNEILT